MAFVLSPCFRIHLFEGLVPDREHNRDRAWFQRNVNFMEGRPSLWAKGRRVLDHRALYIGNIGLIHSSTIRNAANVSWGWTLGKSDPTRSGSTTQLEYQPAEAAERYLRTCSGAGPESRRLPGKVGRNPGVDRWTSLTCRLQRIVRGRRNEDEALCEGMFGPQRI